MEHPSSPSQWAGDHLGDKNGPRNRTYGHYRSVYSVTHPQIPAAILGIQPAGENSTQGVGLSPCFSFGPPGPAVPDIWLDPAVGAGEGSGGSVGEGAGVPSMANGPPTRSSYDMATLADWDSALSLPCPNDVEAADESLVFPVCSTADSTHQPRVFQCKWLGCRSSASFRRETDLIRHLKTIHIAPNAYPCPQPNCGVAFGRKDHLKAHIKTHQKPNHKTRQRPRK